MPEVRRKVIELTAEQQQALDGLQELPPRVVDPRTNAAYVLVPATVYEEIRALLEDERQQRAIHEVALRNAAGRVQEEA